MTTVCIICITCIIRCHQLSAVYSTFIISINCIIFSDHPIYFVFLPPYTPALYVLPCSHCILSSRQPLYTVSSSINHSTLSFILLVYSYYSPLSCILCSYLILSDVESAQILASCPIPRQTLWEHTLMLAIYLDKQHQIRFL